MLAMIRVGRQICERLGCVDIVLHTTVSSELYPADSVWVWCIVGYVEVTCDVFRKL
jgi:hypothetical protein